MALVVKNPPAKARDVRDAGSIPELGRSPGGPVLDCLVFDRGDYTSVESVRKEIEAKFPYPVIVKPVNTGSSIGITWVKSADDLAAAFDEAFSRSARLIVAQLSSLCYIAASP